MSEESKIRPTADAGSDDGRVRQSEEARLRKESHKIMWHLAMIEREHGSGWAVDDEHFRQLWCRLNVEHTALVDRILRISHSSI